MDKFKVYWRSLSPQAKLEFARNCGIQYVYCSQLTGGKKLPSPRIAKRIEHFSGGAVKAEEMLPHIFVVPESAESAAA